MLSKTHATCLLAALAALFACKKDENPANGLSMCYQTDGKVICANAVSGYVLSGRIFVVGTNEDQDKSMRLLMPEGATLGIHEIVPDGPFSGIYQFSSSLQMTADSGSIEVTNIDATKRLIEGKFAFRARSGGAGIFFQSYIADGTFKSDF